MIKAAARDSRIERIVLVPDQMSAGVSTMRELGQALDRFRKTGKDVVVVSEGMEQSQYYLAAHANEILLDPEGWVILEGFANYRSYYRDALDKLGIDVHLVRVGTYKSAAEPYILNQASDAAKEAALFWMGDVWNEFLGEIADLRKLEPAAIAAFDPSQSMPETGSTKSTRTATAKPRVGIQGLSPELVARPIPASRWTNSVPNTGEV